MAKTQAFPSGGQQYSKLRQAATGGGSSQYRMPDAPIKAGTWTVAPLFNPSLLALYKLLLLLDRC